MPSDDLTPAEEIAAAAKRLYDIADDVERYADRWSEMFGDRFLIMPAEVRIFVRAMSPALARHLAAWLESAANHAAKVDDPRNQEIIADPHALAVARSILGEAAS